MSPSPKHLLALTATLLVSAPLQAANFEQQRTSVSASLETQSEDAIIALLTAGIQENLPAPAVSIASEWLRRNIPKKPALLFHAARASELSGETKDAISFHQQALKLADPKSPAAGVSITAIHTLLIHRLNDPASAYIFAQNEAEKLIVNPSFRKFDRWFLDLAKTRNDRPAFAARLLAITKSEASNDHLLAFHQADLLWLIDSIRSVRYDRKPDRFSSDFTATTKALAAAAKFDEEQRLLLDWAVSVKAYNMAKLDDQEAAPPIAESKSLLEKFPRYATLVQIDWAGGSNSQYYREDHKKYYLHEAESKQAPIRTALSKLSPLDQAELLRTWGNSYFAGGPQIIPIDQTKSFILANPDLIKRPDGPILTPDIAKLTPADAAKLAPILNLTPSSDAAYVRAIAAAGEAKDFDKAIAAFHGPEVWRLTPSDLNGKFVDLLWNYAGRPGGNAKRNEALAKAKALAATIPPNDTIADVNKLLNDFLSPQPKIPAVRARLAKLLSENPDAEPALFIDKRPQVQILIREVVQAEFSNPYSALKARAKQNRNTPVNPLEPILREAITKSIQQNKVQHWLVMAWLKTLASAKSPESIALAESLLASPALPSLTSETVLNLRSFTPQKNLPPAQLALIQSADPALFSADLLKLPADADATTVTTALTKAIQGTINSPFFSEIQGLEKLASLPEESFSNENLHLIFVELIDKRLTITPTPLFSTRLFTNLSKRNDPGELLRSSGYLWRHVAINNRAYPAMLSLAESSVDSQPSVASTFALDGLAAIDLHTTGKAWFNRDSDVPRLKSIRGNAATKLGLISIPVAPTHPSYPIYQAQAEWMSGNDDSAWKLIDSHWEPFTTSHRELSVPFLLWTFQQTIFGRDDQRQEFLAKSLVAWTSDANSPLTPTEKATIELFYGDIALQRDQLRQAHEIYSRVRENPAYAELPIRHQASLRRVRAERIAKNYDAALQTLADLELERIQEIWTDVRFARAEVYFDREDFDDSKDDVDSILTREPNHPDARILLGKIQLKRQKLMEATEVELGSSSGQKSLVPGTRLKVTLSDPTLAVSGAGTEIEVVVFATSGDKESFFLRQFGDEKTKFRGEVLTALGAPNPGDGTLQVIGDDQVFYAYSERFREKMNNIDEKRGGPITIASDATLTASARKLLSEAEQRSADMQILISQMGAGTNNESAAKARIAAGETGLDLERHVASIVKPGNLIHVRVSDPDRSRTPEIDELDVSVSATSGDSVSRITLKETSAHSGTFEGIIPTAGAQASAFAQNSEPGRTPNMIISPRTDYPAWRPIPVKDFISDFTVDLNDNLPLGELSITARESGAKLQKFLVQTAMNPSDWTTVATFPSSKISITNPWKPSVTVVSEHSQEATQGARSVYEIEALRSHLTTGWLTHQPDMAIAKNVSGISTALPAAIPKDIPWPKSVRYPDPAVIVRFEAYFHENEEITRRFALDLGDVPGPVIQANNNQKIAPAEFLITVNGRVITTKGGNQLEGEISLKPGIHKIEIWATGGLSNIGFGRNLKLRANLADPQVLVDCPDSYFDPSSFPPALIDHRNAAATTTANSDSSEFKVKFAKDSRARLIRLVMLAHEGPAPALNKLTLDQPDGKKILPVPTDFAELSKNDILEILTGDKISVRYIDDRFVTKAHQRHERFLKVAFTDARVEFADIEPRFDPRRNDDQPYYEKLLRFVHDKPLTLAIQDADMDSTTAPDKVKISIITNTGTQQFDATETGDSTGIFKLVITPVSGPPKNNSEVQVAAAGTITASYMDQDNNRPGIPAPRTATISHASYREPQIHISQSTVTPAEEPGRPAPLFHGFERKDRQVSEVTAETIQSSWNVDFALLPTTAAPAGGFQAVLGQSISVEITAPQLALGVNSQIDVFAQTDQGRAAAAAAAADAAANPGSSQTATPATDKTFDKSAPGTILLQAKLKAGTGAYSTQLPPIYQADAMHGLSDNSNLDRFALSIPLSLGDLPQLGALTPQERYELAQESPNSFNPTNSLEVASSGLVVRPGENIHIGFRYTAPDGSENWATATSKIITHPAFDIMSTNYSSPLGVAYVGENFNLRVVDFGADLTNAIDTVKVLVQAKSGAKHTLELHETGIHTGIFKASFLFAYANSSASTPPPPDGNEPAPYDVRANGFPVTYGDTIAARYTDANGIKTATRTVTISKGADGTIQPFSKKYDDPEIAMRTQFSLAEAYLEVAKRRRKLGENKLAELDFITAKQLLASAVDQFNDSSTRAHAEYLLGSLTMEEADTATDPEIKETRYRAALSRFINITGNYSQTVHAAKAQYLIATIYERLKEPDIAAQEYVKLAYKYPDSEHIAAAMARLGTHFLKQAAKYEEQAKPLLEKAAEDKDAAFEGEALNKMAISEYLKTARIFGRLQERFPTDPLAGQAGLRAGQSFMRANKHKEAADAFKRLIAEPSYDGPSIRAQALYWSAMSYQAVGQPMAAYSNLKLLTYDFPESEWAAYARGQLSQEGMLNLEDKLELQQLESQK